MECDASITQLVLTEVGPKPDQAPQTVLKGWHQTLGIVHKNAIVSDQVPIGAQHNAGT